MRSTESAIAFEPLEPIDAKGKAEPIPVWRATEARSRVGQPEAATRTPFIGREHERTLLFETFLRTERESSVQLVTVVGEPGIGKSRLVTELRTALDDRPEIVTWRHGRCLPYGEGITFWALGEIVKSEAGILESDDPQRGGGQARGDARSRSSPTRARRAVVRLAARTARRGGERRLGGEPGGGVHGVAAIPRGRGGETAVRARGRGPALGRRSIPGVPRPPPRLEHARPAASPLHGASGALRAAAELGRREAERDDDLARSALDGGGRPAPAGAPRSHAPARRDPGRAPGARRREPALRGAVRPDALGAWRRRGHRGSGDGAGAHGRAARHAASGAQGPAPRRRRRGPGLLERRRRIGRRTGTRGGSTGPERARAARVRPPDTRLLDRRRGRVLVLARARPRRRLPADPALTSSRQAPRGRRLDRGDGGGAARRPSGDPRPPLRAGARADTGSR